MRFFDDFVNFTAVNSRFSSSEHNCKPGSGSLNRRFSSLPRHFGLQTNPCSEKRIRRWQNTIFSFLDPQLDFLAIFSSLPYFGPKSQNIDDSSKFSIFPLFDNIGLFVAI